MSDTDDLRGSTPIYTAKDVLVRLDAKVDGLGTKVEEVKQLLPHDLDARLRNVEAFESRLKGLGQAGILLGLVATALSIFALMLTLGERLGLG